MVAARKKGTPADLEQEQPPQAPADMESIQGELVDIPGLEAEIAELKTANEALQQELDEVRAKGQEYLDGWQRALADFSNYKRRIERDQSLTYQNTIGSVAKR